MSKYQKVKNKIKWSEKLTLFIEDQVWEQVLLTK